ncbi:hypothetical protein KBB08_04385 [Candidatus Gracilibacteria bacterium]|nr:hypothetical protein [Candidatus Gracilibacteria bacterium]
MWMTLVFLALAYRLWIMALSLLTIMASCCKEPFKLLAGYQIHHQYTFVFPVYREQKIILDTLKYYEIFLSNTANIDLVFVTSRKETGELTTLGLITAYWQGSQYQNRVTVLTCPALEGTKATQINYALEHLRTVLATRRIVSFDCDARISYEDFCAAEHWIGDHYDAVVYSFVPRSHLSQVSGFFVRSIVMHSLERSLALEYSSSQLRMVHSSYPMGATMLLMPAIWQKIDRLPEPIDDISLQYILRFYALKMRSLPYFTDVQPPPDTKNLFRQIVPIFKGVFSVGSTAQYYKQKFPVPYRLVSLLRYGYYLLEPLGILLALTGQWWLLICFGMQILLDSWWSRNFTPINIAAHGFGYLIRLAQFCYFLVRVLFQPPQLHQFKTDRS